MRIAVGEIRGPIQRIDNPAVFARTTFDRLRFLRQEAVFGELALKDSRIVRSASRSTEVTRSIAPLYSIVLGRSQFSRITSPATLAASHAVLKNFGRSFIIRVFFAIE
jgi:hypothetical protein